MLLQPLVENAVTHGIEPLLEGGDIAVNIDQQHGIWKIAVVDNGIGLESQSKLQKDESHGLALTNIRQRLQSLYGDAGTLNLKPTHPKGVTVLLELPCEQ